MLPQKLLESLVGLFLLCAFIAFSILAFKVSGLTHFLPEKTYSITALFDDIGGLKERAPVKIGGVQIGEVEHINLDPVTFKAEVNMQIRARFNDIPDDSSAQIYTSGLLGDNYIAITPMYNSTYLKNGSRIEFTNSAMVLEKLIGQFIYSLKNNDNNAKEEEGEQNEKKLS